MLKIDTHTATEARGRFARICVQVNFDRPLIKVIKIGGLHQPAQYEGINTLCFSCGRVGHRSKNCPYKVREPEKTREKDEAGTEMPVQSQAGMEEESFGLWVLVSRNRKVGKSSKKVVVQASHNSPTIQGPSLLSPNRAANPLTNGFENVGTGLSGGQRKVIPTNLESVTMPGNTKEEIPGVLKKVGTRLSFVRGSISGQKSKHSSRSQKKIRSKSSPKWKVVGLTSVDELSQSALEKRKQLMPSTGSSKFMEFRVGVSDLDVNMSSEADELRLDLIRTIATSPSLLRNESASEGPLLGAHSNAPNLENGREMDCAKDAAAHNAIAYLKRIDPGIRSMEGKMQEDLKLDQAMSQTRLLGGDPGECLGPEVTLHADEGGDVPNSSS